MVLFHESPEIQPRLLLGHLRSWKKKKKEVVGGCRMGIV